MANLSSVKPGYELILESVDYKTHEIIKIRVSVKALTTHRLPHIHLNEYPGFAWFAYNGASIDTPKGILRLPTDND